MTSDHVDALASRQFNASNGYAYGSDVFAAYTVLIITMLMKTAKTLLH